MADSGFPTSARLTASQCWVSHWANRMLQRVFCLARRSGSGIPRFASGVRIHRLLRSFQHLGQPPVRGLNSSYGSLLGLVPLLSIRGLGQPAPVGKGQSLTRQ